MGDAFPVRWADPSDSALTWEWDDEHLPQALTPLAGDWACTWTGGFAYRAARAGLAVRIEYRIINSYAYFAERFVAPEKEVRGQARESRRAYARVLDQYWEGKVLPTFRETYRWMQDFPVESAGLAAVAEAWDECWNRFPRLWGLHFLTTSAAYQALDDLAEIYGTIVDGAAPGESLRLLPGRPSVLHTVQRDLYRLAESARRMPAVTDVLVHRPEEALALLPAVDGGPDFLVLWEAFLEDHGHLGQPSDDLIHPSWQEEPSLLVAEIRKSLLDEGDDPEARRQLLASQADALAEQARAQLQNRPDTRARFEEALALARRVGPLTEVHNYWLDRMLQAHTRRLATRVGRRVKEANVLDAADGIFFLHAEEVGSALRHPRDLRSLVAERKAQHARWSAIRPPRHLGTPPAAHSPDASGGTATDQIMMPVLRGVAASMGIGRGRARVVRSSAEFERVGRGDVLVCPAANSSWVPLFPIIAGMVTDTGGALSHAAVVAREFGLPAVVGTGDATQRIRDGQTVEVDGTTGEVRLQ